MTRVKTACDPGHLGTETLQQLGLESAPEVPTVEPVRCAWDIGVPIERTNAKTPLVPRRRTITFKPAGCVEPVRVNQTPSMVRGIGRR